MILTLTAQTLSGGPGWFDRQSGKQQRGGWLDIHAR